MRIFARKMNCCAIHYRVPRYKLRRIFCDEGKGGIIRVLGCLRILLDHIDDQLLIISGYLNLDLHIAVVANITIEAWLTTHWRW